MIYDRNKNPNPNNNFDISNKYNELFICINSINTPLCKSFNKIDDLKDGNIFIDLLKNYFQQNNQKYYYSLLNSLTGKSPTDKIKMILQIISQLTNNNEMNSRIELFQKSINNFMNNDDLLMELVLYINYLYKKNDINGNIKNDNTKNIKEFKSLSPFYSYKKNTFAFHRKKNGKRLLKDFYDYNKYKRIIINNFINKNNDNKSFKNLNSNKLLHILNNKNKIDKSLDFKNLNQNDNVKESHEKININNVEIKSYINRPKSYTNKQIQKFYNYNDDKYDNRLKEKNDNNNNYNNNVEKPNLKQSFDNKNNLINLADNEEKEKILYTQHNNKRNDLIDDEDKKDIFISYSSKELNNNKPYYDYKPTNYNSIRNNLGNEKDSHYDKYKKLIVNGRLGIFSNEKIVLSQLGEEELNYFKIIKPTNPAIIDNDNLKKINEKNIGNKLTHNNNNNDKNIEINDININSNNNVNNKFQELANKNENLYTNKENEKLIPLSPAKEDKNPNLNTINYINKNMTIKDLIDNINSDATKNMTRHKSYIEIYKNNTNKINQFNENINLQKPRPSHSTDIYNNYKDLISKRSEYSNSNHDSKSDNNQNKDKNNKKDIYTWLLDLNVIKKNETNIILLPQLVSDGAILCDLINKCESKDNQIDGVIKKIKSKEEALININKALDYLKKVDKFPKRHVSSNELIFEIDDKAIWELLYDLYEYYSNKMGYKKNNNEKKNEYNNLNYLNNLNDKKKEIISRNNNKPSFEMNELNNIFNDNNSGTFNNNLTQQNNIDHSSNDHKYNIKIKNAYNNNLLTNSYNFIHRNSNENNIFLNSDYSKNSSNSITKTQNNSNNTNKNNELVGHRDTSYKNEVNKANSKGYFDYVNELKKHFDRNKRMRKILKNDIFDKKENNIFDYSKDNQKPINLNTKLHFNYSNDLDFNNNNNIMEYSKKLKYNYTNYYEVRKNKNRYVMDNSNGNLKYY